jgi:hypothetical protein
MQNTAGGGDIGEFGQSKGTQFVSKSLSCVPLISLKLHSSAAERRKRKALGASPRDSSISESKAPEGRQHSRLHR